MEQDQMSGPAPQKRFNLWLIATIVLAVLLIVGGVVFAWQKSVGDKAKNDLQGQINTLQNQVQQLPNTNAGTNVNNTGTDQCVAEGGTVAGVGDSSVCCDQSTVLIGSSQYNYPDQNGKCIVYSGTADSPMSCAFCGNGVCGTGENKCNCPADCKASETASYKTYTNNKFGYTVEYPSDWYYKDYNDVTIDNVLLSRVVFSNKVLPSDIGKMDPSQSISVWVENRPFADARTAFLQGPFISSVSETTITVDNVQATKLSGLRKAAEYPSEEVMISKDGKVYTIVGIDSPLVSAAFDRVLSTFKFTK